MAESVSMRTEETIPELEEMVKLNYFDPMEVKEIAKKRQQFEYRLHRQTKDAEDCIRYIQYEFNLLKIVRAKKQKSGVKKGRVESLIIYRLNKLFNEAIKKYQDDIRIWLSYVKFCQQVRFLPSLSRVFCQLLDLHGKKRPELYKLAANWEFEECKCVEKARKHLLNGLQIHKSSTLLYKEAFKLELRYSQQKREEVLLHNGEELNEPVYKAERALVIYKCAIRRIQEASFLVEFLNMAKCYDFTKIIQDTILKDLETQFPRDDITWDAVAKHELNGAKGIKKIPTNKRIRQCVTVYKKNLKVLGTERLWSMYIDTLLEIQRSDSRFPILKKNLLLRAFNSGHAAGKLRDKHYFIWFDMLKGNPEKADKLTQILKEATERLSGCLQLWETRIKFHMSRDECVLVDEVFRKANEVLNGRALPLWKLLMLFYQSKNSAKAEELLKEGVGLEGCPEISNPLKVMYIERLAVTKGIMAARKVYKQMANTPPYSLELHSKMADIEIFQPQLSLENTRHCYTWACKQFGTYNTDVWMNVIKFETQYGDVNVVPDIYKKAMSTLVKPSNSESFLTEYTMFTNKAPPT